jgi:hypothetical protein
MGEGEKQLAPIVNVSIQIIKHYPVVWKYVNRRLLSKIDKIVKITVICLNYRTWHIICFINDCNTLAATGCS